jgi:hypothetical protein
MRRNTQRKQNDRLAAASDSIFDQVRVVTRLVCDRDPLRKSDRSFRKRPGRKYDHESLTRQPEIPERFYTSWLGGGPNQDTWRAFGHCR